MKFICSRLNVTFICSRLIILLIEKAKLLEVWIIIVNEFEKKALHVWIRRWEF